MPVQSGRQLLLRLWGEVSKMYDELIAELRQHHCDAKEDDTQEVCEECSYDVIIVDKSAPSGFASVCVCGLMNRAADAIEELQEDNAALNGTVSNLIGQIAELSKPRWIPVTERLPEERQFVLASEYDENNPKHKAWRDWLKQEAKE